MVKTVVNKVSTKSRCRNKNNQNKDKNITDQDKKKNNKNDRIPSSRSKNKSKIKDLTKNTNRPLLELPQPSLLLQIPLTGNAQNLFWVLPHSSNNK
eukprot:jgi/Orpsp1_1/1179083/evm.model.c7180000067857.1